MKETIEGLRVAASLILFAYVSWSDYKTREVSNKVWVVFAPIAFALTFAQLFLFDASDLLYYGISFGFTAVFSIILFYAGGFGGADAKALMCLALALPFYPEGLLTPLSTRISPISQLFFPITVFSNSVLLAATSAVYLLIHNLVWRERTGKKLFEGFENASIGRKILVLITGYKVSLEKLKTKWHIYPMEDVEETPEKEQKRKLVVLTNDEKRSAILQRLEKAAQTGNIQDEVWASPGLPMLIFITLGLIIALVLGDMAWILIRLFLG